MYQQLFTIAAIFAVNASAQENGNCDDPEYSCTLYSDEDQNEDAPHYTFCLWPNMWGERMLNIGYSFLSKDYGDFTRASMSSYSCGS